MRPKNRTLEEEAQHRLEVGLHRSLDATQGTLFEDIDPYERIKDLDLDGIDAAFLSPSIGLFSGAIDAPELAWAMYRAYNRWLAESDGRHDPYHWTCAQVRAGPDTH